MLAQNHRKYAHRNLSPAARYRMFGTHRKCILPLSTEFKLELGTKYPGVGTKYLEVGTKYLKVGTKYPEVGTKYLEVGTNYLEVGTKYL